MATTASAPEAASSAPAASTDWGVGSCPSRTRRSPGTSSSANAGSSRTNGRWAPRSVRTAGRVARTPSPKRTSTGRWLVNGARGAAEATGRTILLFGLISRPMSLVQLELVAGELAPPGAALGGDHEDPNSGEAIAPRLASTEEAVERALAASFASWEEHGSVQERAEMLGRLAGEVDTRAERIAVAEALDTGVPI